MGINRLFSQSRKAVLWLFYAFSALWLAIAFSWWLMSKADYGYPFWYQILNIRAHITEYAAINKHYPDFEQLSAAEHQQVFREIRLAIHGDVEHLPLIRYAGAEGESLPLLNDDEIRHLQDVHQLLHRAGLVSIGLLLCWIPLAMAVTVAGLPRWRVRLISVVVPLAMGAGWLLLAGPETVFYTLHEWLFPPENPWFFYWEESLMSTLMKAPLLFGGIAVVLVLGGTLMTPLLYLAGLVLAEKLLRRGSDVA